MRKTTLALGFVAAMAAMPGHASQCPPLPEGMRCAAENGDPRAMYMVGREAYETARKTGDFTEAYQWAKRAKEAGVPDTSRKLRGLNRVRSNSWFCACRAERHSIWQPTFTGVIVFRVDTREKLTISDSV